MNESMSKKFISSSALFTSPSFWKGTARIADLFGGLDNYNYKETEAKADLESLKRDWNIIGLDIADAMGIYEQENADSSPEEHTTQPALQ